LEAKYRSGFTVARVWPAGAEHLRPGFAPPKPRETAALSASTTVKAFNAARIQCGFLPEP